MYIKKQTVIPIGFKITKCPPMAAAGRPIHLLHREEEARLEEEAKKVSTEVSERTSEVDAERKNEQFGAALASGMCTEDALDEVG